mmetsp:Transcript_57668/g.158866  ORF Transcript_57668/g.158866 Transcript_57668/m.158866 type:complete len:653 (+) Transcript_57668:641-2599(+)
MLIQQALKKRELHESVNLVTVGARNPAFNGSVHAPILNAALAATNNRHWCVDIPTDPRYGIHEVQRKQRRWQTSKAAAAASGFTASASCYLHYLPLTAAGPETIASVKRKHSLHSVQDYWHRLQDFAFLSKLRPEDEGRGDESEDDPPTSSEEEDEGADEGAGKAGRARGGRSNSRSPSRRQRSEPVADTEHSRQIRRWRKLFNVIDTHKDNFITFEELEAVVTRSHQVHAHDAKSEAEEAEALAIAETIRVDLGLPKHVTDVELVRDMLEVVWDYLDAGDESGRGEQDHGDGRVSFRKFVFGIRNKDLWAESLQDQVVRRREELEESEKWRPLFSMLDVKNKGVITRLDLIKIIRHAGNSDSVNASSDEERRAFERFRRAVPELPTHISQEDGTRDMFESVFHAMDYNDDKVITFSKFSRFMLEHTNPELHASISKDEDSREVVLEESRRRSVQISPADQAKLLRSIGLDDAEDAGDAGQRTDARRRSVKFADEKAGGVATKANAKAKADGGRDPTSVPRHLKGTVQPVPPPIPARDPSLPPQRTSVGEKDRAAARKRRRGNAVAGGNLVNVSLDASAEFSATGGVVASAEGVAGEMNPTRLAVMRATSRAGQVDLPLSLEPQLYRYTRVTPAESRGHAGRSHDALGLERR